MRRTLLSALIAASMLPPAHSLAAEEASAETSSTAIVFGLSGGDLLNIRASASAIGIVIGRQQNGSSLRNRGCSEVNGYKWCKVEVPENPEVVGWVPARYLRAADTGKPLAEAAVVAATHATVPAITSERAVFAKPKAGADEDEVLDAPAADAPQDVAAGATPEKNSKAAMTAAVGPEQPALARDEQLQDRPPPAVPVDLMGRFGADADPAVVPPEQKSAASIGRTAVEDAYGLAFAARENPTTGEIAQSPADGPVPPQEEEQPLAEEAAPAAEPVPIPTPRPEVAETPPVDVQTVAQVEAPPAPTPPAATAPSAASGDATSAIPCARYIGQPMTRCEVSVRRIGSDAADVTVTWPDGGTRIINFYAGEPAGSNSRSAFRFTREGNLNMIRVGTSERFEITDAVAFGD